MITAPRLHRIEFVREDGDQTPEGVEAQTAFHLALNRFSQYVLGVEFGASVENFPGVTASATFRMICTLQEGSPERDDPETAFKGVAARLAPTIMYPYVREALGSAALRAQLPGFVLPVVNFGKIYSVAEVNVPPPIQQEELILST